MQIPVQITFRNMQPSESVEAEIRRRAAKLETYYDRIMGCRVMVELPHHHHRDGPHHHIRIDLTVPGGEIVVKREPSLHSRQQDTEDERCAKCKEIKASHKYFKVALREAFETARRLLQDFARRQRADVKILEKPSRAQVSRLVPEEGYGYIETADGREVYFHRNSVLGRKFDQLTQGSEIIFVEEEGEKGPQASTVKLAGRRKGKAAKAAQA